jgi:hypothetical protein
MIAPGATQQPRPARPLIRPDEAGAQVDDA